MLLLFIEGTDDTEEDSVIEGALEGNNVEGFVVTDCPTDGLTEEMTDEGTGERVGLFVLNTVGITEESVVDPLLGAVESTTL